MSLKFVTAIKQLPGEFFVSFYFYLYLYSVLLCHTVVEWGM